MTQREARTLMDRVSAAMVAPPYKALLTAFAPEGYAEYHTEQQFYAAARHHGLMTDPEYSELMAFRGTRWWDSTVD